MTARPAAMTDAEIMDDVRELPLDVLNPNLREGVADIERNGGHVALYEAISTGTILVITSTERPPPMALIREAYLAATMQGAGGEA